MGERPSVVHRVGETALVVTIPEVEPLVCGWRQRFDSSASAGVPAHVTVLYPFLGESRIDGDVLADLELLLGSHDAFGIRFEECGRFPGVLFLAPTPDQPLRALTQAVVARWPEAPPYAGKFADVIPHLTVAHDQDAAVFDEGESDLVGRLPVTAHVSSVQLLVYEDHHWHERTTFSLWG